MSKKKPLPPKNRPTLATSSPAAKFAAAKAAITPIEPAWEALAGTRKYGFILALVLLALGAALYARTYGYEYTLDDMLVYSENRFVQNGVSGINDIMTKETFTGYFKDQQNLLSGARYRPLSLVTFAIEKSLWDGGPARAHTINWLLYVLCSFFVYLLAMKMLRRFVGREYLLLTAAFAAVFFLLHPLHVEVVANIKGRDEVLCLLLALAGSWSIFHWYDTKKSSFFITGLISIMLSLLSKESSIILPAALPVALWICRKGISSKELVKVTFSVLAVSVLYMLIRYNAVGFFFSSGTGTEDRILMNNPYLDVSFGQKLANVFYVALLYTKLLLFPSPLTHDYYPWHIPLQSWASPGALAGAAFSIVSIYFAFKTWRQRQFSAIPLIWTIMSFLLISNLFINVGTTMNERFMYFASYGFVVGIAYWLQRGYTTSRFKWLSVALMGYFLIFGFIKSYTRIPDWKNNFVLNESGVKVSPNSARANLFMGVSYFQKAQKETDSPKKLAMMKKADSLFHRAAEIVPDYSYAQSMMTGTAAELYQLDGNLNQLLASFKISLLDQPDLTYARQYIKYLAGRGMTDQLAPFLADLIKSLYENGKPDKAREMFNFANTTIPNNPEIMAAGAKYK